MVCIVRRGCRYRLTSADEFLTISDMSNTLPKRSGISGATDEAAKLQGVVPITYVQLLYEYLNNQGIDPQRLLGSA